MTDSFTNIRQIKESGTEIYFEKENIWTFDVKGEQLLIIMNSLPQEEARNISKNTIWRGQRKRFADDNYYLNSGQFFGYDRDSEDRLVVNQEEEEVVKYF